MFNWFRPGDIATKICYSFLGYLIANFFFFLKLLTVLLLSAKKFVIFRTEVLDQSKMGIKIVPASWDCLENERVDTMKHL